MSCCVLYTLNLPVGVILFGSVITFFTFRVASSYTTMADWSVLPPHREIQTSLPSAEYSGWTARFTALVAGRPESLATFSTAFGLDRSAISQTTTDSAVSLSGFCGASAQKCLDFGWVLTNRLPGTCFISWTTFQLYSLSLACSFLSDGVEIRVTTSAPRWPVAQTGPNLGCTKLAPRPGCGILATSTSAASLPVLVSTAAILLEALAATRK